MTNARPRGLWIWYKVVNLHNVPRLETPLDDTNRDKMSQGNTPHALARSPTSLWYLHVSKTPAFHNVPRSVMSTRGFMAELSMLGGISGIFFFGIRLHLNRLTICWAKTFSSQLLYSITFQKTWQKVCAKDIVEGEDLQCGPPVSAKAYIFLHCCCCCYILCAEYFSSVFLTRP
jgi:hypothetical protein